MVLLNTIHDAPEIGLKLVVWKIDLQKVVVSLKDSLSDDLGGHLAHALVFEANTVVPLVKHHLADESLLLFVGFARNAKIIAFCFVELEPRCLGKTTNVYRMLGSVVQLHLLDDWILFAGKFTFFIICVLSQFDSVLVENGPFTFCLSIVEFLMNILDFFLFGFFQILNAQMSLVSC